MKIIVGKKEFEQMVDMWVHENFVEKTVVSSNIEDSQVVIEVSDDGEGQDYGAQVYDYEPPERIEDNAGMTTTNEAVLTNWDEGDK